MHGTDHPHGTRQPHGDRPRVAVLGGGPAGAVAAMVLARAGVSVHVFESNAGPVSKVGESLPPTLGPLLEKLELTDVLDSSVHTRSHGIRAYWGSARPADKEYLFSGQGAGWHVDRAAFEASLSAAAIDRGAHWHWDHQALDARWRSGTWTLEVEGPATQAEYVVDLVIDATGRQARFARGAGAKREVFDRLVGAAVVFTPAGSADHASVEPGMTVIEAAPNGWAYSAPLCDGRMVVVFMSDGDLLDTQAVRTQAGWLALLEPCEHTRQRISPWLVSDPTTPLQPVVVAAGSGCLAEPIGEGWLAIGDAAASFDPLSSHGIGSAMTTAFYGACAAAEHLGGNAEALLAYAGLVKSLFADYRVLLAEHYAAERRWPQSPFWARR